MRDKALLFLIMIALALFICLAVAVAGDHTDAVGRNLPSVGHAIDAYYQESGAVREHLSPDDLLARTRDSGGFTYNPLYGATPRRGFAVSLQGHGKALDIDTITGDDLWKYLQENGEEMRDPAQYCGGWVSDGKLYLDVSIVLQDEKDARKTGWVNGQIVIYDLGANETIYLKGPDGSWLIDAGGNWQVEADRARDPGTLVASAL